MNRNLASLYIERYLCIVPLHEYPDLSTGLSLHPPDHTVLREADAGDIAAVHLQDSVTRLKTGFLGRAARNDLQHNGGVIRHIELNPDAVKVAGKLGLRLLKLNRWKIDGMRVKSRKRGFHSRICNLLDVHLIHIVLLHLLKNEIQLPPLGIIAVHPGILLDQRINKASAQHTYHDAEHCSQRCEFVFLCHLIYIIDNQLVQPQFRTFSEDPVRPEACMHPYTLLFLYRPG